MTLSMPSADERRQQVLDRLDRHRFARQAGRDTECPPRCVTVAGISRPPEVGAPETDAEVGRRRLERERDLVAGVKADSGAGDRATKCALCVH